MFYDFVFVVLASTGGFWVGRERVNGHHGSLSSFAQGGGAQAQSRHGAIRPREPNAPGSSNYREWQWQDQCARLADAESFEQTSKLARSEPCT